MSKPSIFTLVVSEPSGSTTKTPVVSVKPALSHPRPKYYWKLFEDVCAVAAPRDWVVISGRLYFRFETLTISDPRWVDAHGRIKYLTDLDNTYLLNIARYLETKVRNKKGSSDQVRFQSNWLEWCKYEIARRKHEGLM